MRNLSPHRRRWMIAAALVGSGFAVTFIEVLSVRMLAPYFGATTLLWSLAIGAVIAALSVGNFLGGLLIERRDAARTISITFVATGLWVIPLPWIIPLVSGGTAAIREGGGGLIIARLVADLFLLVAPAVGMGAAGTIALSMYTEGESRRSASLGKGLALSAAGALIGAASPVAYFIPFWGSSKSLLLCGGLLAVFGLSIRRAFLGIPIALLAGWVLSGVQSPAWVPRGGGRLVHAQESRYGWVRVVQRAAGETELYFDDGINVQSYACAGGCIREDVWGYMAASVYLAGPAAPDVLILGLGGGTTASVLHQAGFAGHVTGVELDPAVVEVSRVHLGLANIESSGFLRIVIADARRHVAEDHNKHHVILLDAYRPPYVPFYLTTQEFFRMVRTKLHTDGLLVVNAVRVGGDTRFVELLARTLHTVFPVVYRFEVPGDFNTLLLAAGESGHLLDPQPLRPALDGRMHALIRSLLEGMTPWSFEGSDDINTDDRAPVEHLINSMAIRYIRQGAR